MRGVFVVVVVIVPCSSLFLLLLCGCLSGCRTKMLTLSEPQSRFGGKPLKFQVVCPQLSPRRDCSPKRVKLYYRSMFSFCHAPCGPLTSLCSCRCSILTNTSRPAWIRQCTFLSGCFGHLNEATVKSPYACKRPCTRVASS